MFHHFLHSYSFRFHYLHRPDYDVFAFIARAVAEGFTGVAINANGPNFRHLSGEDDAHIDRVRAAIDAAGLLVDFETSGTDPAHLARLLKAAHRLGARHLRTYTRHAGTTAEKIERTAADLRVAANIADACDVVIVLENHEEFTGTELAEILRKADSPRVQALYDYGNSQMLLEDPHDALAEMAPWIRTAHLKDHVMIAAKHAPDGRLRVQGVPVGDGFLDIAGTTRRLLDAGVDRICFENVWGYSAPVQARAFEAPWRAADGQAAFRYLAPPFDPEICCLDPMALGEAERVALEERAFVRGLSNLRRIFADAGLEPHRP
jgi:sugar phosphate isomerase/epimerase